MRTTLTLDDDIAAKLRAEVRRSGKPFRVVVNEVMRRGLISQPRVSATAPFKVNARDLGESQPGYDLDNIGDLLERIEGPLRR
jgi:hypothetical protein